MLICSHRSWCLLGAVLVLASHVSALARQHEVKEGESLWIIAARFNTTVEALSQANGLTEDAVLKPGQELLLPASTSARKTSSIFRMYRVREGDTLSQIAERQGMKTATLRRLNSLADDDVLRAGSSLRIPVTVAAKPSEGPPVGYVTGNDVSGRTGPGKQFERIATADKGARVELLGKHNGWFRARFDNGREAWVSATYVKTSTAARVPAIPASKIAAPSVSAWGFLTRNGVGVHSGPGTDWERVASGAKGTRVRLYAKCNGWFKVAFSNGTQGWVHWEALKTDDGDRVKRVTAPPLPEAADPTLEVPTPKTQVAEAEAPPRGTLPAGADLHSGPSVRYPAAGAAAAGTECDVLGKALGWYKVRIGNAQTGWVAWDKLDTDAADRVRIVAYPALPEADEDDAPSLPAEETRVDLASDTDPAALPESSNSAPVATAAGDAQHAAPEALARALAASSEGPSLGKAYAVTDGVNLRKGPGVEHEKIRQLRRGSAVDVLESRDGWYRVKLAKAPTQEGWVAAWLVSKTVPSGVSLASKDGGSGTGGSHPFVSVAMRYRGVPYRRGGTTSRGFDCSGLVNRVLATNGIPAPRTAAQLFHIGTPVAKKDLRSGDLVFFRGTYRRGISHVGIYIGDGKFIHASTSGRGVTVTELNSSYYVRKYAGARRVR